MSGNENIIDKCTTLHQHREILSHNPYAYTYDLPRVYNTIINHIKNCGYQKVTLVRCPKLIETYVTFIFDTQSRLPFFYVEGNLPYCWNSPGQWDKNYIRYEWGHLYSRNQCSVTQDKLTNLCLQSARCNQHVQTSMNIDEVLMWLDGSRIADRIRDVLKRREMLFKSYKWAELVNNFEKFR